MWKCTEQPKGDKFQYTHFAHVINSFDTAPQGLLPSDSRLRPDRYALEMGDMSKAGSDKTRYSSTQFLCVWGGGGGSFCLDLNYKVFPTFIWFQVLDGSLKEFHTFIFVG